MRDAIKAGVESYFRKQLWLDEFPLGFACDEANRAILTDELVDSIIAALEQTQAEP